MNMFVSICLEQFGAAILEQLDTKYDAKILGRKTFWRRSRIIVYYNLTNLMYLFLALLLIKR